MLLVLYPTLVLSCFVDIFVVVGFRYIYIYFVFIACFFFFTVLITSTKQENMYYIILDIILPTPDIIWYADYFRDGLFNVCVTFGNDHDCSKKKNQDHKLKSLLQKMRLPL